MSFKDMLSKKTAQAKKGIQKAADSVKLYSERNRLENELADLFDALGRIRYSELAGGTETPEETAALVNNITELNAELDKIEAELDNINNVKHCPKCESVISDQASFCPYCGAKLEEEAPKENEEEKSEELHSESNEDDNN